MRIGEGRGGLRWNVWCKDNEMIGTSRHSSVHDCCAYGDLPSFRWIRGDLPAMWEGVTGKLSTANSAGKPAGEGDEESPGARLSGSVHDDDEDSTQMATERTALLGGNPNSHAPK